MENYLGSNLKYLRKKSGENQSKVATVLAKANTTIGNWENGISEPNIIEMYTLSQYFGVSIDDLIKKDLSKSDLTQKNGKHKTPLNSDLKSDPYTDLNKKKSIEYSLHTHTNTSVNEGITQYNQPRLPAVITLYPDGEENIVFVPVKARAGYLLGYEDPSFIEKLPTFRLPGFTNSTYRMFEVDGPSMAPTVRHKDRVVGEWVQSFDDIRENRCYIIIHKDGVAVKRVVNRIKERGVIYLKSDTITHRHDYPTIELKPEDIREMWYVCLCITADLREPTELYQKVNDLELTQLQILKHLGLNKGN